ncbi:hypothetical protein [Stenotrophomonas sp. G4]|uniref:hypothetical protein n=1 Tax=Stenotrophomonas sp. G4 TaxID=2303750 RepID=UPI0013C2A02F|nr:hypothetical protein [Stenotrophomonas sp. G4]
MPRELMVDGQLMHVLNDLEWESVVATGTWEGRSLGGPETMRLRAASFRFTKEHGNLFAFALCKIGPKFVNSVTLMAMPDGWTRVKIEKVGCNFCGTKQLIANPLFADLYFGVENGVWKKVLGRFSDAERLGCIKCESALPRFAIWSEACHD